MSDLKSFDEYVKGKKDTVNDYRDVISASGDFKRISGMSALINSIRNLLLTPLGSYPFDPEYGSLLYKKIFDPADEESREEIEYEVTTRIRSFHSEVNIESVVIEYFADGKGFTVHLKLIKPENEPVVLSVDIDPGIVPGLE